MKTIKIREWRDRDGRIWEEVKGLGRDRLTHDIPPANRRPGAEIASISMEREVVEYLVGPLTEVLEDR